MLQMGSQHRQRVAVEQETGESAGERGLALLALR